MRHELTYQQWSDAVIAGMQLPFPGRTDYSLYEGGFRGCYDRGDSPAEAIIQLIAAVQECEPSPMGAILEAGRQQADTI